MSNSSLGEDWTNKGCVECPVVQCWLTLEAVVARGGTGKICEIKTLPLSREAVADNSEVLYPVLKHFGTRPSIHQMMDVAARFLYLVRPRGKSLPKSGSIKTEAWILRRLVSIFSSVARRPHTPREQGLRDLYGAVGIPLPSLEADEGADPEGDNDEDYEEDWEGEETEIEFSDDEVVEPVEPAVEVKDDKPGTSPSLATSVKKEPCDRRPETRTPSVSTSVSPLEKLVTPPPRKSKESPETGTKETCHRPIKCAWVCIYCKAHHQNRKLLEFSKCTDEHTKHRLVESCVMCEFCHQLGDTKESLDNGPCPKRLDFTKESGKTEKCETPVPVTKTPSQIASNLTSEMEKANKELKRLQILKAMAEERDRLAALIERKNKSCLEVTDTLPMCEEEIQHIAAVEAAKKSPKAFAFDEPAEELRAKYQGQRLSETEVMGSAPSDGERTNTAKDMNKKVNEAASIHPVDTKPAEAEAPHEDSEQTPADKEPSLSPAEQMAALKEANPKRRGRPPTRAPKAKAKSRGSRSSKPKAKAKPAAKKPRSKSTEGAKTTKRSRKGSKRALVEAEEEHEHDTAEHEDDANEPEHNEHEDELTHDASKDEDQKDDCDHVSSGRSSKRKTRRKAKAKKELSAKDPAAKTKAKAKAKAKVVKEKKVSSKPAPSSSTTKRKQKTESKENPKADTATEGGTKDSDRKKQLSRKSCAYKKARKQALDAGKTMEEAVVAAKQAYKDAN